MNVGEVWSTTLLVAEYLVKIVAVGVVPENRKPSSSQAWLLAILFIPAIGLPLFLLIGSPYVRGRRERIQREANHNLAEGLEHLPSVPPDLEVSDELRSIVALNRHLTSLPCVTGRNEGLYGEEREWIAAMAEAVADAEKYVHVEIYTMSWDATTDPFFTALADAVTRGVHVRVLMDHLGSVKYPRWRRFKRRLDAAGIDWHVMMPIDPLRGRWRRPDLRNHRELMVVDGTVAIMGSQNMIDAAYGSRRNAKVGRRWKDLNIKVTGGIVASLEAVFAVDWYTETGEHLRSGDFLPETDDLIPGGSANAMQLVPSGPGFATEPNLRLFTTLIGMATERVTITSPYFVPDEALLTVVTTAAYRGVRVDLFVSEQADQFVVGHAQQSYYKMLLEAGVHIYLYPKPKVLHSKYLIVDDRVGVIGSSNMDFRSFQLDYEIMLMGFGGDLVECLQRSDAEYRAVCRRLTLQEWNELPWPQRYVNNVMKLFAALQ